jgi:predicted dehydrogenase
MGIKLAVVGTGSFAQCFIPLFKAHPLVSEIVLADVDEAKLRESAARFGVEKTLPSLDAACESDADAIAIMTPNWMHAPQAVQALRAGKHVYSAVPTGISVDEIAELVKAVEDTGKIYMLGETSYYRAEAIYCREKFRQGEFGRIVYSEGEYYHDWDHGLYEVFKQRCGEKYKSLGSSPPMHYPTHSTSHIVSVTGAHMTHVSCHGFIDCVDDGLYIPEENPWRNPFSNQTALFKMSDGSSCRINEFRRIGYPGAERMSMYGTEHSFECGGAGKVWVGKDRKKLERLDDVLACGDRPDGAAKADDGTVPHFKEVSSVHPVERLPREFAGLANGHGGSHCFLVDDFVRACVEERIPPNNVWQAARYALPGIAAHESSMQGGALLNVPDFGDPGH